MKTTLRINTLLSIGDSDVDLCSLSGPLKEQDEVWGCIEFEANGRILRYVECIDVFWTLFIEDFESFHNSGSMSLMGWTGPSNIEFNFDKARRFVEIHINDSPKLVVSSDAFYSAVFAASSAATLNLKRLFPGIVLTDKRLS